MRIITNVSCNFIRMDHHYCDCDYRYPFCFIIIVKVIDIIIVTVDSFLHSFFCCRRCSILCLPPAESDNVHILGDTCRCQFRIIVYIRSFCQTACYITFSHGVLLFLCSISAVATCGFDLNDSLVVLSLLFLPSKM